MGALGESAEFRAEQTVHVQEQPAPPGDQSHMLAHSAIIGALRICLIRTRASRMAFKATWIQKHDSRHSPLRVQIRRFLQG